MLLEFCVKNFLSIKDDLKLSLYVREFARNRIISEPSG